MKTSEMIELMNIITIVNNVGIPAVMRIISTWESDREVTPEMIEELKNTIKPASELFKN